MKISSVLFVLILFMSFPLMQSCKHSATEGTAVQENATVEAGIATSEGLNWYHIDDLAKMNIGNKRVLVDVYTDWCGWCKVMDKKTFTDQEVADYLKKNFVLVKFDAEQQSPVQFRGTQYDWIPAGRNGVNQLAVELLEGRLGYPTIVYLDSNLNKIRVAPGYKTPEQLMGELRAL